LRKSIITTPFWHVNESNLEDPSDEFLVQIAQKGDIDAFTDLARWYHERIFHTIAGLTKSQQDADVHSQATFLQAYRSLKSFKKKAGFYAWIYRIAVNKTLNFLKKRNREIKRNLPINNEFGRDIGKSKKD